MKVPWWDLQPIQRWLGMLSTGFVLSGVLIPPWFIFKKKKKLKPTTHEKISIENYTPEKGEESESNSNTTAG